MIKLVCEQVYFSLYVILQSSLKINNNEYSITNYLRLQEKTMILNFLQIFTQQISNEVTDNPNLRNKGTL